MHLLYGNEMRDTFLNHPVLTNPEEVFGGQSGYAPRVEETEDGTFNLIVEDQKVVENMGVPKDELLLWAASFPVFNQKAPAKTAKNALAFLSSEVLEKGGPVMGNRVHGRVVKLKRMMGEEVE